MAKRATKKEMQKERKPQKIKKVLKQKGYKNSKLPSRKVLHHVKPVVLKGKTTAKNTKVITKGKHIRIHKNRRKRDQI